MPSPHKRRMVRLFYPREYQKFPWFGEIGKAKERYHILSAAFDKASEKEKLIINQELEIIDDYFDWLQMVGE